jgi:hypothetical protein
MFERVAFGPTSFAGPPDKYSTTILRPGKVIGTGIGFLGRKKKAGEPAPIFIADFCPISMLLSPAIHRLIYFEQPARGSLRAHRFREIQREYAHL